MKILYHPLFIEDNIPLPENSLRIQRIIENIQDYFDKKDCIKAKNGEEYLFHDKEHIRKIKDLCNSLSTDNIAVIDDKETYVSKTTYEMAC